MDVLFPDDDWREEMMPPDVQVEREIGDAMLEALRIGDADSDTGSAEGGEPLYEGPYTTSETGLYAPDLRGPEEEAAAREIRAAVRETQGADGGERDAGGVVGVEPVGGNYPFEMATGWVDLSELDPEDPAQTAQDAIDELRAAVDDLIAEARGQIPPDWRVDEPMLPDDLPSF